jgi:segregation and condensation protein B
MSESDLVNPSQLSTKLEAILYLKAQPLSIQEIADYAICEIEDVEEALLILMQDYAMRDSALEVVETNAGFSLQLREAYMSLVQTIVPTDLGVGALRTLAAIALKGPISQTQLVELRGSGAYQHVGDLAEEGFISKRRQSNGRSFSVQVTEKFYQYFEVDELPKLKLKNSASRRRVIEDDETEPSDTDSSLTDSTPTLATSGIESPELPNDPGLVEAEDQEISAQVSENSQDISLTETAFPPDELATESESELTNPESVQISSENRIAVPEMIQNAIEKSTEDVSAS